MRQKYIIGIMGPTGVGKTDFALRLGELLPVEIINGDMGQLYAPLHIGTAKSVLPHESVVHHMFDVLDTPRSMSVREYRDCVDVLVKEIQGREYVPVVVGGSGFYLMSLLYPPIRQEEQKRKDDAGSDREYTWQALYAIDPERAQKIHPHDQYRVARALALYYDTGVLPSTHKPVYDPIGRLLVVYVTRERNELRERIRMRTRAMIEAGWIEEVQELLGSTWEKFLLDKKIIGYDTIIRFIRDGNNDKEQLIEAIVRKTWAYAKQQETYGAMFMKRVQEHPEHRLMVCNLTERSVDLYINHIIKILVDG